MRDGGELANVSQREIVRTKIMGDSGGLANNSEIMENTGDYSGRVNVNGGH